MDEIISGFLKNAILHLKKENIVLPKKAQVSIYHHCGTENFDNTGAVFVNIINRDYCKSYVVMCAGQHYPIHYHKIKNESFYVLRGELNLSVDGVGYILSPGEMLHVERGSDHSFWTLTGCVFEEISTMYIPNDSVYLEESIAAKTYNERRTKLSEDVWEEMIKNA